MKCSHPVIDLSGSKLLKMSRRVVDFSRLFLILTLNFVLPPHSCTLACNFVNVYTIRYRVHVRIPNYDVEQTDGLTECIA